MCVSRTGSRNRGRGAKTHTLASLKAWLPMGIEGAGVGETCCAQDADIARAIAAEAAMPQAGMAHGGRARMAKESLSIEGVHRYLVAHAILTKVVCEVSVDTAADTPQVALGFTDELLPRGCRGAVRRRNARRCHGQLRMQAPWGCARALPQGCARRPLCRPYLRRVRGQLRVRNIEASRYHGCARGLVARVWARNVTGRWQELARGSPLMPPASWVSWKAIVGARSRD